MQSQNGWQTIDGTDLDNSPIPGTDVVPVPGLRKGDVATVLLEVGRLFNETVQKVYNPGCWGWNAPMPIPGSNILSNHGSGTAIDFNAPSFPQGLHRMTAEQADACRAIVNSMDGVVAWGGDYTTTVDQMHFEIVGNPEQVSELAKKIKGGLSMDQVTKIYEDMDARNKLEDQRYNQLLQIADGINKKIDSLFQILNATNVNQDGLRDDFNKTSKVVSDLAAQALRK